MNKESVSTNTRQLVEKLLHDQQLKENARSMILQMPERQLLLSSKRMVDEQSTYPAPRLTVTTITDTQL